MARYDVSDEDKRLFRASVGQTTPVKTGETIRSALNHRQHHADHKDHTPQRNYALFDPKDSQPVDAETVLFYARTSLPKKRLLQLKSGQIPYQAHLDLHGFRIQDALNELIFFIEQHVKQGHRCVLIIHGKGGHHGEHAVLKTEVYQSLQRLPQVQAFHSAMSRHGGTGAVYVLLRHESRDSETRSFF